MSNIEWTDETWNPLAGCSKVSEGCRNCYAMKMAQRIAAAADARVAKGETCTARQEAYRLVTKRTNDELATPLPQWNNVVVPIPEALEEPYGWKQPRLVFVNSMSDLFHEDVPFKFIAEVFTTMAQTFQHTYQVLTKRPRRMLEFFAWNYQGMSRREAEADWLASWPNVWLGVSVENQEQADERIPLLLQVPAVVRFLSCEPLLGPIDLNSLPYSPDRMYRSSIDWVIVGGESGHDARHCGTGWIRGIIEACKANGTACFVKQVGSRPVSRKIGEPLGDTSHGCDRWTLIDRKGGDMSEWPEDLRVREFPKAT